ncbi:hypothetical protein BC940DRAFT_310115 [Gongronella butleri]|nr:hypothetical protein BC940DRAFT_310115 [Gongronella butleri]
MDAMSRCFLTEACNLDLLICVGRHLAFRDLLRLSSCCRHTRPLAGVEVLWKSLCRIDYGLTYKHPDQLYRVLYQNTRTQRYGRAPCPHLSLIDSDIDGPDTLNDRLSPITIAIRDRNDDNGEMEPAQESMDQLSCQRCSVRGSDTIFICATRHCHQIVCDRHARLHARPCGAQRHSIFFKPNMGELFCQACVDWVGGNETDPAEQFKADAVLSTWVGNMYADTLTRNDVLKLRAKRRLERGLRWTDTPKYIMQQDTCFFISSRWMADWELFVEGWSRDPPSDPIDHDHLRLQDGSLNPAISFSPFAPDMTDLVVVSPRTWQYLVAHYILNGRPIAQSDLVPRDKYEHWTAQLAQWRSRLLM